MLMMIGEKIKFFREKKGLSQAQMAEILNMSVQGYGNIERGATDLPYSRLELISKELGIKPEQLIAFGENNHFVHSSNNILGDNTNYQVYGNKDLHHEIETLKLNLQSKDEKIHFLEREIGNLQKINALLEEKAG